MTVLSTSDRLLVADDDTREVIVGSDSFLIGRGGAWHGQSGAMMRVNHRLEVLWSRSYFSYDPEPIANSLGSNSWGRAIALTKDEAFLYAVGDGDRLGEAYRTPNFMKLDAATGDSVWERETSGGLVFYHMVLDPQENIYIFGADISSVPTEVGVLKKYSPTGDVLWTKAIGGVTGIVCDSFGDVYCSVSNELIISPATASGLYKLDGENGDQLWYAAAAVNSRAVAINKDNDIFVMGGIEVVDSNDCQLFKYAPDSNTRLDAVEVGEPGFALDFGQRLACDSLGNVIALNWTDPGGGSYGRWLVKFTSDLALVWEYEYPSTEQERAISVDVQNRVHTWGYSSSAGGYRIHAASDGSLEVDSRRLSGLPSFSVYWDIICSKDVHAGIFTDQVSNLDRPDMCCFHDVSIPYLIPEENVEVDTKYWFESIRPFLTLWTRFMSPVDNWIGVFKGLIQNVAYLGDYLLGNDRQLELLSRTPSCTNENWDLYDGFGGVGAAPQIYTVTFVDMLNVSDDEPSPYNGEYLLVVGPGLMGFFFRHENDNDIKINFTVEEVHIALDGYPDGENFLIQGDGKEKLVFTVGDDSGNVFTHIRTIQDYDYNAVYGADELVIEDRVIYQSQQANNQYESLEDTDWWIEGNFHNEKLTATANTNNTSAPNLAYGGTVSMYPGKIAQWDSDTVWAVDAIVAWQGRFYKADNQNQNSEPPSVNWTII